MTLLCYCRCRCGDGAQRHCFASSATVLGDLQALRYEKGSAILSTGALAAFSSAKTGRSPLDKRVVEERKGKGLQIASGSL